jgi:superfamily I DNA/RNA helicase
MPASCVESVLERTKLQVGPSAEQEHWYVTDATRLRAVDGRPLDEGTATAHAGTVDVEDYAVLFELDRLRAERRGRPPTSPARFELLAIDEAQELSPLELALLGRSVVPGGTLVVSGDADQQTDTTTTFPGWEGVMRELGRSDHDVLRLRIGYRCPPHVEELARAVRDGRAARIDPREPTRGARTVLSAFPNERTLVAEIGTGIDICRSPRTAQRLAPQLRAHTPLRLVLDGRFLPRGAAQASTVDEVKGLEFDYVIVPDADARDYPDDPASRRALYVAITRARHQVLLAHTGEQTPLIQSPRPPRVPHPIRRRTRLTPPRNPD